jgi:hypothetical protein
MTASWRSFNMSKMTFRYDETRLDEHGREYIAESTEANVYGRQPGKIPIEDILAKFVEFLKGAGYYVDKLEVKEITIESGKMIEYK